jgi:hypothetical protein
MFRPFPLMFAPRSMRQEHYVDVCALCLRDSPTYFIHSLSCFHGCLVPTGGCNALPRSTSSKLGSRSAPGHHFNLELICTAQPVVLCTVPTQGKLPLLLVTCDMCAQVGAEWSSLGSTGQASAAGKPDEGLPNDLFFASSGKGAASGPTFISSKRGGICLHCPYAPG